MSKTPKSPRSRTPSRVGTPRLIPNKLHAEPSVTSLRVHSMTHGNLSAVHTPASASPPNSGMHTDSSSSSTVNGEPSEGILVQEPEVDVDAITGEMGTATGRIDSFTSDEDARKQLRDHLRRTLTETETSDIQPQSRLRALSIGIDQHHTPELYPPRRYFVLTDAGKPVFVSRQEDEQSDSLASTMGLMQALISVFLDDGDKLRSINAGNTRISFLLRPPLYYACVSAWGEPESVTRLHLEYLHMQIISVVSAEQLRRMFERRGNFNLSRLLSGAESFMHTLLSRLEFDLAMSMSSLSCLKLDFSLRKSLADVLVPTSKIKDVLYMILVAQGRVVTLVRPKKHSIHSSDLHILLNTIHAPSILNSSASASWIPVCLPRFNPSAFLNAYVTFIRHGTELDNTPPREDAGEEHHRGRESGRGAEGVQFPNPPSSIPVSRTPVEIGLVCVSGQADFEAVRSWCTSVVERLEGGGLLQAMSDAIMQGQTTYSVSDLSIPGLRHFLYKSRHVQVTMPEFEEPYDDNNEKRRLVTLYQILQDNIQAKSGQENRLKLQYLRTERESILGWITQNFEMYLALSPLIPKSAAINAANAIDRWVNREERKLFLSDVPVF